MEETAPVIPTFYLGLCMAGAVSAGAYTAGVIDYLTEALDTYEQRRGKDGAPSHRVEIPVMGGASAGGMTSVITAAVMQQGLQHLDKPSADLLEQHAENGFYHSWVDLTDKDMFTVMMGTSDIRPGEVISLFNSDFISKIASRMLSPVSMTWQPLPGYFAAGLKIFTTLSNLQGFRYDVNFKAPEIGGRHPYYMQIHNDYACFQLGGDPEPGWIPLDLKNQLNAKVAIESAMATGAFPVGLRSREVTRESADVNAIPWLQDTLESNPVPGKTYTSLNIDGGMINNEPFEYVRKVLTTVTGQQDPAAYQNYNKFKSTVVMIAPFPSTKPTEISMGAKLMHVIRLTLSAMISQMRSKPAHLVDAMDPNCAGQFLIDPSRPAAKPGHMIQGEKAIACGAIDGFSGFLNKEFRVHDYFLGRYNCKIFLRDYFTVPEEALTENLIFAAGYASAERSRFKSTISDSYQIIPVFEDVDYTAPDFTFGSGSNWPAVPAAAIDHFKPAVKKRVEAILLNLKKLNPLNRALLWIGSRLLLRRLLAGAILDTIKSELAAWHLIAGSKPKLKANTINPKPHNNMATLTTAQQVKTIILDVSQLDGTIDEMDPRSALSDLGFNGNMCYALAGRLDSYVKSVKSGAYVNNAEITSDMTVQAVIDLVTQKLA